MRDAALVALVDPVEVGVVLAAVAAACALGKEKGKHQIATNNKKDSATWLVPCG